MRHKRLSILIAMVSDVISINVNRPSLYVATSDAAIMVRTFYPMYIYYGVLRDP